MFQPCAERVLIAFIAHSYLWQNAGFRLAVHHIKLGIMAENEDQRGENPVRKFLRLGADGEGVGGPTPPSVVSGRMDVWARRLGRLLAWSVALFLLARFLRTYGS